MQALKLSSKSSIYWRSILIIVALAMGFLLQSCGTHHQKYGAATPDRVIEQYLISLENRNETSMLRLIPEHTPAERQLVRAKIAKIGGHQVKNRQVKYTKSKPTFWNAKISGNYIDRAGIKRRFDDSIAIEYQSKGELKLYAGRWYLVLGN
ncbi:hypothetical protein [Chamaesiphon sp. GL140_3_metabinner_50]|uniref:hypothetical protein n=1 Tax=Chamaesiphon sp. GL140_3_metabinner_50 TaxID=2970812 RepID=UPI0025E0FF3B|nr:hypothetical protein [Chamaesiphon sp. GL140_3_metabinner_50]